MTPSIPPYSLILALIDIAIIIASLSPDVREPTPLESYLCRSLALAITAYGILVVLLTGSVPMTVTPRSRNDVNGQSSLRAKTSEEHPTAP
jgi:ribose/xylose/arabinose/galactoside ABC-type transport system permease subunit